MIIINDLTTTEPEEVPVSEIGVGCLFYKDRIDLCLRLDTHPDPDVKTVLFVYIESPTEHTGTVDIMEPDVMVGRGIGELELYDYEGTTETETA